MKKEATILAIFILVFVVIYRLPMGAIEAALPEGTIYDALAEALKMVNWYARKHTLACVVPALFIAGAITAFLSKEAVLRYLGPKANKVTAYLVASVAGTVLAVCSCSVLPMFAGIYRVGAGLGPASAFLYAGPAINVLAVFLTARVLGLQLGVARVIGAVVFGVVIGLIMAVVFRKSEEERTAITMQMPDPPPSKRALWQTVLFFVAMIAFLVFSDWYNPGDVTGQLTDGAQFQGVLMEEATDQMEIQIKELTRPEVAQGAEPGPSAALETGETYWLSNDDVASLERHDSWVIRLHRVRWYFAGAMGLAVLLMTWLWFDRKEVNEWMDGTWSFAKMLVPLLFGGVFVVGFLKSLVPEEQVAGWVGDNSLSSNFIASIVGCLFYFATLTEIPILEALMDRGMAPGPALALLLAGPALSIPSILVIRSVLGNVKTLVFTILVVVMATGIGMMYGAMFP